jgi:hypothetical protein
MEITKRPTYEELLLALELLVKSTPNDTTWNYPAALENGRQLIETIKNKLSKAMPQLNEYSIEELEFLRVLICDKYDSNINGKDNKQIKVWINRVESAICDREFTDSQLPFRTPKEIE